MLTEISAREPETIDDAIATLSHAAQKSESEVADVVDEKREEIGALLKVDVRKPLIVAGVVAVFASIAFILRRSRKSQRRGVGHGQH